MLSRANYPRLIKNDVVLLIQIVTVQMIKARPDGCLHVSWVLKSR